MKMIFVATCSEMNGSQDDDAGKKCDWKEPKYKKYDKKGNINTK